MSQLGFDDAPKKIVKDALRDIDRLDKKAKTPEISEKKNGDDATTRAANTNNQTANPSVANPVSANVPATEVKPEHPSATAVPVEVYTETDEEVKAYPSITPMLRDGPIVDKSDPNKITSTIKWQRAGSDTCRNPGDEQNYCRKALALQDVLLRFSGNNEFYESHCLRSCQKSGFKSMMTYLRVESPRGEQMKVVDPVKDCSMFLSRLPGRRWMLLNATSAECACVPEKCILSRTAPTPIP